MEPNTAFLLIIVGALLFPILLAVTTRMMADNHVLGGISFAEWALVFVTLVSGSLLFHWIPRIFEVWEKCT